MNPNIIPCISIRPSMFVTYDYYDGPRHNLQKLFNFEPKPRPLATGFITASARKKINNLAEWFFWICRDPQYSNFKKGTYHRFKCSFITLTLPSKQVHSDELIKSQCLNQFFIELKNKHYVKHYLWRAEKQVNGNIHFHVLCDRFILYSNLQSIWNRLTEKLGYVHRYSEERKLFFSAGFKKSKYAITSERINAEYKSYKNGLREGWRNPPSTNVKGIFHIKNLKNYIQKYIGKSENSPEKRISGKLWDCSYSLKIAAKASGLVSNGVRDAIDYLIEKFPKRVIHKEYASIFLFPLDFLVSKGLSALTSIAADFLEKYFPPPETFSLFDEISLDPVKSVNLPSIKFNKQLRIQF